MQAIVITNKNKYKVNQLSAQQLEAIQTWASVYGRTWKSKLSLAWFDGNYQACRDISCYLQQVRNQFGPEWLVKFSLKKAIAAADQRANDAEAAKAEAPVSTKTIEDLKNLSLEQVGDLYSNGDISADLTEEYIELWNRGPHFTKVQLTDGVIRNYLAPEPVYYYRKLKATGLYKCAGHGAEDPSHRAFYLPFFQANQDNDPRFEADCILSEYKGDTFNPPAPEPVVANQVNSKIIKSLKVTRIQAGRYMAEVDSRVFFIEKVRNLALWDLRESKQDGWINDYGTFAEAKAALLELINLPATEPVLEQITGPVEPCPLSDRELAAYQPQIVLDAITNALHLEAK